MYFGVGALGGAVLRWCSGDAAHASSTAEWGARGPLIAMRSEGCEGAAWLS
jgi:hypothetical protein